MQPAIWYFTLGLLCAFVGSFLAARLLRIDRWGSARAQYPAPDLLLETLIQAAQVNTRAGAAALVAFAESAQHPLLARAFRLAAQGRGEQYIRKDLENRFQSSLRLHRAAHALGRVLTFVSPTMGIAGMTGAMFLALRQLEDPTNSATGLALSVLVLLVGAHAINIFLRRIPKDLSDVAGNALAGTLVIEGVALISRNSPPEEVRLRLQTYLGNDSQPVTRGQAA